MFKFLKKNNMKIKNSGYHNQLLISRNFILTCYLWIIKLLLLFQKNTFGLIQAKIIQLKWLAFVWLCSYNILDETARTETDTEILIEFFQLFH